MTIQECMALLEAHYPEKYISVEVGLHRYSSEKFEVEYNGYVDGVGAVTNCKSFDAVVTALTEKEKETVTSKEAIEKAVKDSIIH